MTKKTIMLIRSLRDRKSRKETGLFIAEGVKIVGELLKSELRVHSVYVSGDRADYFRGTQVEKLSRREMERISPQKSPQGALALAYRPESRPDYGFIRKNLTITLDDVRDPGNVGTIIRTADWFGIKNVICSETCADAFGDKAVRASSGSIFRVNVFYEDIIRLLRSGKLKGMPSYAAVKDGENIYEAELPENALVIFGSEARGINGKILSLCKKISIPRLGGAESLNVSTAAAVICSELCRNHFPLRNR